MSASPAEVPAGLRRDAVHGVVGGVCAGAARHLGLDPVLLRAGFVLLTALGGVGIAVYAVAWAALPADASAARVPRRARSRGGRDARAEARRQRRAARHVAVGAALVVLALLLLAREAGLWWDDAVVWPLVLAVAGVALLWRPATRPEAAPAEAEAPDPAGGGAAGRLAGAYRGGFGIALVLGAALLALQGLGALGPLEEVLVGVVVIGTGATLVLLPFLWRLGRGLATERAARIRAQERAELAAHLHDSVLQTLALVQQRAGDPAAVAQLARHQERELRTWLGGGDRPRPDERLGDALAAVVEEIERDHGVRVELVVVGDAPLDEGLRALVAAVREAGMNAARHAGGAAVDVYAEVREGAVEAFVRDRGPGFDPDAIAPDRRGVRESIIGRMARHGGQATIRSAAGTGTEVELVLPRGTA